MTLPDSYCRKCGGLNHWVYFAPVCVPGMDARTSKPGETVGTHVCLDCAISHGFCTSQGDLKEGVVL